MPQTTTGTIIDHLTADHQQIKVLFSDVMFVRPENRADVFCQLVVALVQHEVAEEMVVYPTVRATAGDEAGAATEARLREQAEAEQMSPRWSRWTRGLRSSRLHWPSSASR